MKNLVITIALGTLLASCSLSRVKKGTARSGASMDALRDGESISVRGISDESIKIKVLTSSGESCSGEFNFQESSKGWFGFMPAKNIYTGKFNSKSKSCKEALGDKSNSTVELQHIRMGGILGSDIMANEGILVCDDNEGLCLGQNTFKISKE